MKSSYLANLNIKYIQTGDNSVYKITPDHFLKLSPWEHGDDRRIYEVEDNNYHMLTFENACMIVNKQFANTIANQTINIKDGGHFKADSGYGVKFEELLKLI